jgi:predicted acylesterase/phospholipase RssA
MSTTIQGQGQMQCVQLALQGGGAKFVALVAVLQAIEGLEANKQIKVTRLAGTSAGALAACLFSARIPMHDVRTSLREGEARRVIQSLGELSVNGMAWKLWRDRTFWDTSGFEKLLRQWFEPLGMRTLNDLKVPVTILSTNLGGRCKHLYPPNHSIVDAIIDSCGLPYCFRVWNKNKAPVYVDGGLCENLPSGELLSNDNDGPVVAVSFDALAEGHPKNLKEFSLALLDSAISNSVVRARKALPESSVFTISADLGISTFDFNRALGEGLNNTYELVKTRAQVFFEKFATKSFEGKKETKFDPWTDDSSAVQQMLSSAWEIHKAYQNSLFKYVLCRIEILANSLANNGQPDRMRAWFTFKPSGKPVHCLRFVILEPIGKEYLGRTYWIVRDENGNEIKTTALPARDPENPDERCLLLFFNTPLLPENGIHTLFCRDYSPCILDDLAKGKGDELEYWPLRPDGTVQRIELIFIVPNGTRLVMADKEGNSPLGRRMKNNELRENIDGGDDGFESFGWVGENLTKPFGVNVFIEK